MSSWIHGKSSHRREQLYFPAYSSAGGRPGLRAPAAALAPRAPGQPRHRPGPNHDDGALPWSGQQRWSIAVVAVPAPGTGTRTRRTTSTTSLRSRHSLQKGHTHRGREVRWRSGSSGGGSRSRLRGVRRLPGPGDCRQAVDKVVDNCPDSVESVWTPEKQQVTAANFRSGSCAIRTPRAASRCTSGCTDDSAGTTRPPSSHTWRGPAGSVPHSAAAAGQARRPARQDGITSIARPRATAPPGRGCCYRSGGGATVPAAGPGPSGRSAGTTWPRR
jgi:hypothetical protein